MKSNVRNLQMAVEKIPLLACVCMVYLCVKSGIKSSQLDIRHFDSEITVEHQCKSNVNASQCQGIPQHIQYITDTDTPKSKQTVSECLAFVPRRGKL